MATISGSIVEQYLVDEWRVRIHRASDGFLERDIITTSGSFSEVVPDVEYYVIVSAEQGDVWQPGTNAVLNQKVYPTQPSTTRFYFKCTTPGTTGTTEPTWGTNLAETTADGTAVWTVVEGLVQPITHAPVRGI